MCCYQAPIDKNLSFEDLRWFKQTWMSCLICSPDEFLKTLKEHFEKSKWRHRSSPIFKQLKQRKGSSWEMQSVTFNTSCDLKILRLLRLLPRRWTHKIDLSELYKYDSVYYLTILVDVEGFPERYPAWLLAKGVNFRWFRYYSAVFYNGHLLLVTDASPACKRLNDGDYFSTKPILVLLGTFYQSPDTLSGS